jgi:hypothetical protein
MGRLVADENLRATLGRAGQTDVKAHALPAVVTRLEELYASVLTR